MGLVSAQAVFSAVTLIPAHPHGAGLCQWWSAGRGQLCFVGILLEYEHETVLPLCMKGKVICNSFTANGGGGNIR